MRNTLLALLAFSGILAGCDGGNSVTAPPEIKEAKATRDVVDGAAQLKTTITVLFDRDFSLVSSSVKLESRFELQVPDVPVQQGTKRVFVQSAERSSDNPRLVTLHINSLVPTGTTLSVARASFQSNMAGAATADVASDLTQLAAFLASHPLQPGKPAVVDPGVQAPVTAEDRDPTAVRNALGALLDRRGASSASRQAVLDRYDSIPPAAVPSPKLRAALAALAGTFAQPALDSLFTNNNCTGQPVALIAFQPPPGNPALLGQSTRQADGRRVISINPVLEGERIEDLMSMVAHEAIHCDNFDGRYEEIAATAFDSFLYLGVLVTDPSLATAGTLLSREFNIDAIALINSGRRYPESVGVLPSVGTTQVLPGTASPAAAFADYVAASYPEIQQNDSPEEPLARAYSDALAAIAGIPPGPPFNLTFLDQLLGAAMDPNILAADIGILGLVPAG